MAKKALITQDDVQKKVLAKLEKALSKGASFSTAKELNSPKSGPLYKNIIESLVLSGGVAKREKAGKELYFLKQYLPSDPVKLAKKFLTQKFLESPVWIYDCIKVPGGSAFKKVHLNEALSSFERENQVKKIDLQTSAKSKKPAYLWLEALRNQRSLNERKDAEPTWEEIEHAAREIAAHDFARVVTFEKLAERLGVSPLILHLAFQQKKPTNMVLLPGRPTSIQDFDGTALTHDGQKYACFSFRD